MAKSIRRCAVNPIQAEFSLCGDAFDIQAVDDHADDYVIAEPGQSITCPNCCLAIREIKALRNPLRPRKEG